MNKAYAITNDIPRVECINPKINKYRIRWDFENTDDGVSFYEEDILHKPSLEELQNFIIEQINAQTKQNIISGFSFADHPVWLSTENQFNYKAIYDLALQSNGEILPVVFKFGDDKNPIYYKFESLDALHTFYTKMVTYINSQLTIGWQKKDSIDWDLYEV